MAKLYRCNNTHCKYEAPEPWRYRCPQCFHYFNCTLIRAEREDEQRMTLATAADAKPVKRIQTGIPELDKVLGGSDDPEEGWGIAPGEVVLFGAPSGTGKTTMTMQVCDAVAQGGAKAMYAAGEMNRDDLLGFARRFGIKNDNIAVLGNASDIYKIVDEALDFKPKLLVVDSVQTSYMTDVEADVGQVAQMDAVVQYLTSFAKEKKVAIFILCHVTNLGEFAGGSKIRHLTDALLRMDRCPEYDEEGDVIEETKNIRKLSIDGKNRYGADDAVGYLEMTSEGMKALSRRKSRLLLVD